MPFDREREMFTATCGDCGNECQIPFKPKDDRPVYCRECFQNVSKIINPHNVVVALDMAEDLVMVEMTEVPGLVEVQEITDQEKCLTQPVVTVEMNVKYHSSQKMIDLFIAKNVSKIINKISKLFSVTLKTPQFY
jgi:CxxC-x17-CxxC domain-containing protein